MKGEICIDEKTNNIKLTRGTIKLIKEAISANKTTDSKTLSTYICFLLEKKYKQDNFIYQTKRMGLNRYSDVKNAVDSFIYNYLNEDLKTTLYNTAPLFPVEEVVIINPI